MRSSAGSTSRDGRDTVLYDGACRFCRGQVALLRRCDPTGRLVFRSVHDEGVSSDFPGLSIDALLREMHVVDRGGRIHRGAAAIRHLSRRLVPLWPLAALLHVPGSLPLWEAVYRAIARNRYRIAGRCTEDTCGLG